VTTAGTGFHTASVALPLNTGVAVVVAVIVTGLVDGSVLGGVYRPVAEIVPTELDPPAIPFTAQVTELLLELLTVALNCAVDPRRTWLAPLMVTCGIASVAELLAQPARASAQPSNNVPASKPSRPERQSEKPKSIRRLMQALHRSFPDGLSADLISVCKRGLSPHPTWMAGFSCDNFYASRVFL
jgi:hypothetical protein